MARLFLMTMLLVLVPIMASAQETPEPSPSHSPEQVVAYQLEGLKQNDNKGLEQVWAFAHPQNKRFTGPLARFALMLTAPNYRILLGHRSSEIRQVSIAADVAIFEVTVTDNDNRAVVYQWGLRKVAEGDLAGSWMTVTVSPPTDLGNEI